MFRQILEVRIECLPKSACITYALSMQEASNAHSDLFWSPCPESSLHHAQILQRLLDPQAVQVERPLASLSSCGGFRAGPLRFDRAGPLARASARWTQSWARLFTQRLWTLGYQEQAIASIFDALPASFCAAVQSAADRLQGRTRAARARCIADVTAFAEASAPEAGRSNPLEMTMDCAEEAQVCGGEALLECLEDLWERDGAEGFIEFTFDPATQQRTHVQLNSRTAAIAGMHKEEVLARLAAHDAPISFLPLDYLCALLHQSLRAAAPSGGAGPAGRAHSDVMHVRMTRTGSRAGGSSLVRMEVVTVFNARGQVTQVCCV